MASLNPLSSNLDLRKAKHLLRRATFNYSKEQIDTFVGMSATAAVNSLTTALPNTLSEPYDLDHLIILTVTLYQMATLKEEVEREKIS